MNFEFLKDLDIIQPIYRYCANAEDLAKSMPDNSMFASRKSAEALAKTIYRIAHNEEAQRIDFIDILNDPVVRKYVSNPSVINAFHFIRKKGNEAVHTMTEETEDAAISVLRNLHFVFGETAKKIGLINKYPVFNADIENKPDAVPLTIDDVDEVSRTMFAAYVANQARVDELFNEIEGMMSPITIIPSYMDIDEYLQFDHKPETKETIVQIQRHFLTLALCAKKDEYNEEKNGYASSFHATLTIAGPAGYTTSNLREVLYGLRYDLPDADGFTINSSYHGSNPYFEDDPITALSLMSLFDDMGKTENFTYKTFQYHANSGGYILRSFRDGKYIDPEPLCTTDVLDKHYPGGWFNERGTLAISYDFPNHPDILQKLRDVTRKHCRDQYEIEECENIWEMDDEDTFTIVSQLCCDTLREMQNFLDEINRIIKPITEQVECTDEYCWYLTDFPYGIAFLYWTDVGFIIKGTEL